ncbi:nucleotidyltransferase family protein [Enterovibrio sp. 27052020O]|uniref:nucleotidyltransferase family protein n=1 Tax=Enterovibrio sp. 27052020O TaxID=3241166 RepID=UPI00388ED89E
MQTTIIALLEQDPDRMRALQTAQSLGLSQCYLAAGFVRNLVWDHLHEKPVPTPLNDVDLIYFDPHEPDDSTYLAYEAQLHALMPSLNWQVRNQANMHVRNGDPVYRDVIDAMSYWPEKETAVAARLSPQNEMECISAFGFESLFALRITPNPKRDITISKHRIKSKNWLTLWPKLMLDKST